MNHRTLRLWLKPGLLIKRYVALFMLGIILTALALAMAAAQIYRTVEFPDRLSGFVEAITLQFIPHPWREIILLGGGLVILAAGVLKVSNALIGPLLAADASGRGYAEIVSDHRFGPVQPEYNVVTIGGGTGLSALLRGLKRENLNITAIVTVADDGGSTGRIRDVYNMPAPGDIRNCLVSLADAESLMSQLFAYRFEGEKSELAGHAFGNLFITAMTQVTGSFEEAVIESARVLNVRGRVLPSTVENITLCADLVDGTSVRGESTISHEAAAIQKVYLDPPSPSAYSPALAAIINADLIVLGPGSLYTSVIPNLLVNGITEAISWSQAATVYVCNVATQNGETDHFGYKDHIGEIVRYLGEGELDYALVNSNPAASEAIRPEWSVEAVDWDGLESFGSTTIIARDVVNDRNPLRHDPDKLPDALMDIMRLARPNPRSSSPSAASPEAASVARKAPARVG
jgi:uncharacterized cofD-like protein